VQEDGLRSAVHPSKGLEVTMAKGQMRSNREKKKPKQDKNKKKSVKLGTSYANQYGKKH
jgi:hypothetical protein